MQRLRVFHAQCARAMCRVTRKHTWEHHISSEQLRERLGLDSIELYIHARQLRWLGHVRRMGPERLPRLMLSAWVAHKRPAGAPQLTYGRTVAKAMDTFDLDPARWPELAADRGAWRTMLRSVARRRWASGRRRRRRCRCRCRTSSCGRGAPPPRAPTPRSTRRGAARTSTSDYKPLRCLPIVITEPIQRSRRHLSTRV